MYPVAYSVQHEEEGRNRLTVFFRLLLAIPWAIWLSIWGIGVYVTVVIAWFALLFTGRYPEGIYDFHASFLRFNARFHSWYWLLVDEWPPFGGSEADPYPARLRVDPPLEEYSRVKVLFRIILLIPVAILAWVMSVILQLVALVAWFVLVFTARLPEGLYKPMRAASAYLLKAGAYYLLITETYPPFWEDEADEAPAFVGAGTQAEPLMTQSEVPPPPPAQQPPPPPPPSS